MLLNFYMHCFEILKVVAWPDHSKIASSRPAYMTKFNMPQWNFEKFDLYCMAFVVHAVVNLSLK